MIFLKNEASDDQNFILYSRLTFKHETTPFSAVSPEAARRKCRVYVLRCIFLFYLIWTKIGNP